MAKLLRRKPESADSQEAFLGTDGDTSRMLQLLEGLPGGLVTVNAQWIITHWNAGVEKLTGVNRAQVTGRPLHSMLPGLLPTSAYTQLRSALISQQRTRFEVFWDKRSTCWRIEAIPFHSGLVLWIEDISELRHAREQKENITYYDPLTGLGNALLLRKHVEQQLQVQSTKRYSSGPSERTSSVISDPTTSPLHALLLLDLDYTDEVLQLSGYEARGTLMNRAAQRLRQQMTDHDALYRYDEKTLAMLISRPDDVQMKCAIHHILQWLEAPFVLQDEKKTVQVAAGHSLVTPAVRRPDDLLLEAYIALKRARTSGRNTSPTLAFGFSSSSGSTVAAKSKDWLHQQSSVLLLKELKHAKARGELSLHYQPQVDAQTGCITGNEALLRWHNPVLGHVSPGDFIPLAEESGLIVAIGYWVLRTACIQNKRWQEETGLDSMRIAVNVSPRQLHEPGYVSMVRKVLEESGLEPQALELEITEGMTLDVARTLPILQELRTLGVRIAIDDFGKGYNSMRYLQQLPIDTLKIDRSFIQHCASNTKDAALVRMIISVGQELGLRVLAEGVEEQEQMSLLLLHGCTQAQGYLFSRPVPAAEWSSTLSTLQASLEPFQSTGGQSIM
ncbi:EAL domain-containing protein [Paenibacillus barcinonensis]|uniref:EAL domain-containing protein n=1 Tax=Paenibacillus barcinonensis TaxID=198119 RepID=A0ABX6Q844_PAEBA|nr:EAL domain-containing protein [Paenibacillus barcinonensis]QKS57750.1 EAL domain-containing protein [Paenibacillus barcinonensis]